VESRSAAPPGQAHVGCTAYGDFSRFCATDNTRMAFYSRSFPAVDGDVPVTDTDDLDRCLGRVDGSIDACFQA
jgi:hypothetical protein